MNNLDIAGPVTPIDVKIYTEDGIPYLNYTGTCFLNNGCKVKINIPKIGLEFTKVTTEEEDVEYIYYPDRRQIVNLDFRVFVSDDKFYTYKILEREVSKKQLEKELGYKLNIKED